MKLPETLYWEKKLRASSALTNPKVQVTISSAALEVELRKAHLAGQRVGFRQGFDAFKTKGGT